jgi:ABC-2 type transport system ATP-binding protein
MTEHTEARQQAQRPGRAGEWAIEAHGLVKRFGDVVAVDGLELRVPSGVIYALLGPNGAGKTTAVRMFATLSKPDAGQVVVLGEDAVARAGTVRRRIALTGQFASVDEDLTGSENLVLIARLLGYDRTAARRRGEALLGAVGLSDAADRPVKTYSGGMRRRLDIAASLVVRPDVLFLDEPTTGLDPHSRRQIWEAVRALAARGTTVVLTTQYLEEADALAQRIGVIDRGRLVAEGTSAELRASVGAGSVRVRLAEPSQREAAIAAMADEFASRAEAESDPFVLKIRGVDGRDAVGIHAALVEHDVGFSDFSVGGPTLDDAFLALTGHGTSSQETA